MAEIRTNIPVNAPDAQAFVRFRTTSAAERPLPQGDAAMRISPFDDYFLFTLYEEVDGEDRPIDLSNVGTVWLSFLGKAAEIRIPYYTNVQDLDLAQGQVLFRITAEESKKILALDNDNFYISTQGISPEGDKSDESVLYTGKFLGLTDAARETLTKRIKELESRYAADTARLEDQIAELTKERDELAQQIASQETIISTLSSSNQELSDTVKELTAQQEESSTKISELQRKATEAQAAARESKKKSSQSAAVRAKQTGQTSVAAVRIAANALQKSSI